MVIVKVKDNIMIWVIVRASIRHMVTDRFRVKVRVGSWCCSGSVQLKSS